MSYHSEFQKSVEDPNAFWADKAKDIHWFKEPKSIISQKDKKIYRWFEDGMLNTAYLCLDHHVEQGRGDQAAIIYDSPVTNTKAKYTYRELRDQVALFAGALTKLGVRKGDRVVVYMPMVPQAAVAMLACARIGAIHSVVFGGFAARELAVRIDDAKPKVVVSASCGIEFSKVIEYKPLLDRAIERAEHKPEHCVILQRPEAEAQMIPGRDLTWDQALEGAEPADCVPVEAGHPLYILYTSGTTGKPKGIVRDNGGHAVALKYSMKAIYGVDAGDVYWAASDVGWVVGHSYIVYGPLLAGCSTILFEGKPVRTPDPGTFWRIMSEYKVKSFFTAPTAFRAVKKEDPEGKFKQNYDLSNLKYVFLAGERLDPPTYHWLEELLGLPVLDHWWQTETGWAIVGNMAGIEPLPVRPGSATVPAPGFDVRILDENGDEIPAGKYGDIVIKLPLPPGCLPTLWNDDARFEEAYLSRHSGYYLTGDGGYKDEDGYVFIMGRTDDVINVAGHRLSTGEIEELVARHPAVAECAVMGIADDLRGQVPAGFVVLKDGYTVSQNQLETSLVQTVRGEIGPFACFKQAAVVQRLPKTRSGKILRGIMKKIADGEPFAPPSTIDDMGILDEIRESMSENRIGRAFQETTKAKPEPAFSLKKSSEGDLGADRTDPKDQSPEQTDSFSLRRGASGAWRLAASLYLADRPGELADVSTYLAGHGANIELFFYNRSENPNLVKIEADCATAASAGSLADGLQTQGRLDPPKETKAQQTDGANVTDLSGLLKIKITLENKPGTLAAFARILKEHQANVIYMAYDGGKAPGLAEMAMATKSPDKVSALLQTLNRQNCHFHVSWQGAQGGPIDEVIGLNQVEALLLNLKTILPPDRLDALTELIQSSDEMRHTLLEFRREAGMNNESMAASEVFTNILHLAAASMGKTDHRFSMGLTGPLHVTDQVSLYVLACPTGGNAFLLRAPDGDVLIDSSYGLYFPDVKKWLTRHNIDPSRIGHALFTHPDADHAGWAAPLEQEFGTKVFMHPNARAVLDHENRAFGGNSRLMALNGPYTKLVNRFTDMQAPRTLHTFPADQGRAGGLKIIGKFEVGDVEFKILESLGGHVPAQVFFFAPDQGLLFCGDYMIDVPSLSDRTKSTLSIARMLMTSTNNDSRIFAHEMELLREIMTETNERLKPLGKSARIFPGHGGFYSVEEADWDQQV